MILIDDIKGHYESNLSYYENLEVEIEDDISGRVPHHRIVVLNILSNLGKVKRYLEIGVHNGASMAYVLKSDHHVSCFGVDLFESLESEILHVDAKMQAQGYITDGISMERTERSLSGLNAEGSFVLIKGNSRKDEVIKSVGSILDKKPVDLLFIDGDHSYSACMDDFRYSKYLKKGGFVVFDDYHPTYREIMKAAEEVTARSDFEFLGTFMGTEYIVRKVA